ncbi:hypothetical protein [Granulicella sp. L46]|uniref:hypothetical protein n=1 Tax=Granulicella sp. L46 TaxID=1641865 RepID=UPI00131ED01D|nr:hypothetical protein [Granulicella sp. L46]
MKQLFAVALMVVVVAAPACAQHGGGGHGGSGGGFHGGGFSGRGGFAAPGGFSGAVSRGASGGRVYAPRYGEQSGAFGGGPVVANARPSFYHGGWERRHVYGVRYGYGVGVGGVGYGGAGYGWLGANDPGYDSGYDSGDDPGNASGYGSGYGDGGSYDVGPYQDGSGVAAEGYGAPGGEQVSGAEEPPVPYAAEAAEPGSGEGAGVAPGSLVARTSPDARGSSVAQPSLYDNDAVTLIFKDGRAPEKIYNYAMTRTTLYVTDAKRQEIPIAALDLAATEKVNHAAGVRFQLPVTQ